MYERTESWTRAATRGLLSLIGAGVLTFVVFLILPLMQTIGDPTRNGMTVREADTAVLQPPPPPPPVQQEEEEEPPPPPPKLQQEAPPLDLSQLELALNPGVGDAVFGDFAINIGDQLAGSDSDGDVDQIFSLADLDRKPEVIFQRKPNYPHNLKNKQGTVYVIFIVDVNGKVVNPKIQKSTNPAFERPALEAVRQWKFEPGTRRGKKVQFKMRIPITFSVAS